MRSYIRHPSDIPIHIQVESSVMNHTRQQLNNVSYGGLAFSNPQPIPLGTLLRMQIDSVQPAFSTEGIVTHCRPEQEGYIVGIEFIHRNDLFVARMVEQICHIEHYKREVAQREGRHLSGQQAAKEWIAKYAAHFPQWSV